MYTIRTATTADCLLIQRMAQEAFPATYASLLSAGQMEYMMEWMYATHNLRKQMEEGHIYLIAYHKEHPCGYASMQQEEADIFHLHRLYVLPSYQGKQCGSFLLREVIKHIKEIHPTPCSMELNVNRNNKAVEFYRRMGMEIKREGDFPIGNGYYMNDYIMGMEIC